MIQQDEATKRLRFEKFLEEFRLELEEEVHKYKGDYIGEFQTKVRLSTLEYIQKIYELTFNGHVCNKEELI